MRTIRTVTFHHAHNYGSALQTYALQQYITELGREKGETINYQVIDFYTDLQQELYSIFKHDFSVRSLLKNCVSSLHFKALKQKHQKFETFLSQYCNLTHRYHTPKNYMMIFPKQTITLVGVINFGTSEPAILTIFTSFHLQHPGN